jgi:hypothetical protein
MSRSYKRNIYDAINRIYELGGRIPIIRRDGDRKVSHSGDCWMCVKGTCAKRVLIVKPRRRKERAQLARMVEESRDE